MTLVLRSAEIKELNELHDLCMRSKAYWGYDEAFMKACTEELRISEKDLDDHQVMIAEENGELLGVVQLIMANPIAELDKLFICPNAIGKGVGKKLFKWAQENAKQNGAETMIIHADPFAEDFYVYMGAVTTRTTPSGSIEGRVLPFMEYDLKAKAE